MQSARFAAECTVQALARPEGLAREHALRRYPAALDQIDFAVGGEIEISFLLA